MIQDSNVERVIKNYTEPLQKQISMMQIELEEVKKLNFDVGITELELNKCKEQRDVLLKVLEEIKLFCDGNKTNENNIWHKCNKAIKSINK